MRYSKLGSSPLEVSRVCLGSMTWGRQNTQADADEQLDYAFAHGVNFIDTAEMYAVPPNEQTYGKTEQIIGDYFRRHPQRRENVILASKIAGPGLSYVRNGSPISGESIIAAVDASLARLQTDYIDLYQLHWPNRSFPHFGQHHLNQISFSALDRNAESAQMLEILQALDACVKAGKIRYCGLSNETPWGINEYLRLSEKYALPRMVSIQNEFSLLHTKDWPYLIENCVHQEVAYLPWSPLAGGAITGKYLNGQRPEGTRWTLVQRNGLFRDTPSSEQAIQDILELAKSHNLSAAQLALAWCDGVDGVTSTIIGATSLAQLKENMDAFNLRLSTACQKGIAALLKAHPQPF